MIAHIVGVPAEELILVAASSGGAVAVATRLVLARLREVGTVRRREAPNRSSDRSAHLDPRSRTAGRTARTTGPNIQAGFEVGPTAGTTEPGQQDSVSKETIAAMDRSHTHGGSQ